MARSRCRVGWWSLRGVVQILRPPVVDRPHERAMSNSVTGQFAVTSTRGRLHGLLRSLRNNRLAALASRWHWTKMSKTLPSWSTARHRYCRGR